MLTQPIRTAVRLGAVLAAAGGVLLLVGCTGPDESRAASTSGPPTSAELSDPTDTSTPTTPAVIGEPAAFVPLGSDLPTVSARTELAAPAALDRYLMSLPDHAAAEVRTQLAGRAPWLDQTRLFAFTHLGCLENRATLIVNPNYAGLDRLTVFFAGHEGSICEYPTHRVAFFVVPERLLR